MMNKDSVNISGIAMTMFGSARNQTEIRARIGDFIGELARLGVEASRINDPRGAGDVYMEDGKLCLRWWNFQRVKEPTRADVKPATPVVSP